MEYYKYTVFIECEDPEMGIFIWHIMATDLKQAERRAWIRQYQAGGGDPDPNDKIAAVFEGWLVDLKGNWKINPWRTAPIEMDPDEDTETGYDKRDPKHPGYRDRYSE